jgi:hypothetical protein
VNARRLLRILFAAPVLFVLSCGGETDPQGPDPCFDLQVEAAPGLCAGDSTYTLDASCSTDGETSAPLLEVRWDLDGDGDWDTPYTFEKVYASALPAAEAWTVRCEVRDGDGLTEAATRSFSVGPFPAGPEVVAEGIRFRNAVGDYVTAARPDDALFVEIAHRCVGEFDLLETLVTLDGEIWFNGAGACTDAAGSCHAASLAWTPGSPDTFTFRAALDPGNAIVETDEGNNAVSATIVVVP